jgi:peptide/nickel transport system substrate-binding protein
MNEKKSFTKSPLTRRQFLKLSAASTALTVAPTIWPRASWSAEGNILKVRDYSDFLSLDPAYFKAVPEENINACLYNKLIDFKPGRKWAWELQAAKSIKQTDPTHIKFELKEGIMHSGGFGEMTAEDVKYSFERIANPENKSPNIDDWGPLEKVEVTGKYSGTIVFKSPFQPVWWTTLPYACGNIVSMKATEKAGGKYSTQPPSFSGPYMLKEWKPKQRTVLAINSAWKGPKPDFDEIHILPIDDEKTAEIGFEAGDIDFTRISISSLQRYEGNPPPGGNILRYPSLYWLWMGMNMEHPKLKDLRVRKAVQMAVDVNTVVDAAYFGFAEVATGIIPPGLLGAREKSLLPMKADIAGAKKLLSEAGYANGIDLTLDILNKTTYNTIAQVIQATLAQAGIRVQINIHESGSFWVLGSEKDGDRWKDLQLVLNRFSSVPDPSYYTRWYVKDQVGIWNWERFRNDEYDTLHQNALGEVDQKKRAAMYRRMQDILEESGCYRFITNEVAPVICRKTIAPALRPDGIPLLRKFKRA